MSENAKAPAGTGAAIHQSKSMITRPRLAVSVNNLRRIGKGNIKAFVDILLPEGISILDCRIVQQPGQTAWLAMPQTSWAGDDGKTRQKALVKLPPELQQVVQEAALEAFGNE